MGSFKSVGGKAMMGYRGWGVSNLLRICAYCPLLGWLCPVDRTLQCPDQLTVLNWGCRDGMGGGGGAQWERDFERVFVIH